MVGGDALTLGYTTPEAWSGALTIASKGVDFNA
ncbi:hypothetical protein PF005_g3054 [Phytophthora fragariae]|nr:hypothetical protein PF003_g35685 [Phytophthora fragariae]KAE8947086.1 hypothetical protein PF009_g3302 [Phytophthora fragariae]KAE9026571.1 hypothetical protein PF011_g2481 [Phytophthora fragariae]KAE9133710.1 hypothetical protein PF010_g2712 [Phytophthora fragariae]KAE9231581.1 hypothetical protein PF005_g3054 [Phytophthora fragariae]